MIIFCLISTIVKAEIQCEDAGGVLAVGRDGQTLYCASSQMMNWWSAFSWCNAVGGKMFDITTECPKAVNSAPCPQLCESGGLYNNYWTINVVDSTNALTQNAGCHIYPGKKAKSERNFAKALCTMPTVH